MDLGALGAAAGRRRERVGVVLTVVPDPDADDGPHGPNRDPDLAAALAQGIPAGLTGAGLEHVPLDLNSLLCTVGAYLAGVSFDRKTGDLLMTFGIQADHTYIALPVRDAARRHLVLSVYAPTVETRERYGKGAATERVTTDRRDEIRARHAIRKLHIEMKEWVGPGNKEPWE